MELSALTQLSLFYQAIAKKLCEKDPSKLNQWKQPETAASDVEESSDEGEPIVFHGIPFPDADIGDEENTGSQATTSDAVHQQRQQQQTQAQQQQHHHYPTQHISPHLPTPNPSVTLSQPSVQSGPKMDHMMSRSNTTAAAAAAAAIAAAAVAAAASGPSAHLTAARAFSGMPGGPVSCSNGVQTYVPTAMKIDMQSVDKAPLVPAGGILKEGNNPSSVSHVSEPWRFGVVNARTMMYGNNKDANTEIKSVALGLGHPEPTRDLQDKTLDSKTSMSEVPNKTEILYGGQSLHPPANR